ncbi:MAG: (E)-4-hydroxy-3-methylbut-2-enyl-diphosphate synthase [Akkermansia sp.]
MNASYCPSPYRYTRRITREVMVGNVGIGGTNPIRIQSMLTSDTRDTVACVKEALQLADAGCEIIRLTAQTKLFAANLENIARELRASGCDVPLVADIHFKPDAAMEAAKWVEKIRVNPGNFIDKKKFEIRDYTDSEYEEELDKVRSELTPLILFCKEHGRSIRIGSNHGSLSDRIMNRYGDTPEGMVESALEFAKIARELDYHQLVFSMKSSNVKVMIAAYRILIAKLYDLGDDWNYPIHLGVTEAGGGEDGRIKSAVGIGSLLADGIGDTLRVSLTEDAVYEVPVAQHLAAPFQPNCKKDDAPLPIEEPKLRYNPFVYERLMPGIFMSYGVRMGWDEPVRVVLPQQACDTLEQERSAMGDFMPELSLEKLKPLAINPLIIEEVDALHEVDYPLIVTVSDDTPMDVPAAFRLLHSLIDDRHLIMLKDCFQPRSISGEEAQLTAARNIGSLLCDGIGDAILIQGEPQAQTAAFLAYNVLQASGTRLTKADYVSCPSCGRTLYNIQEATAKIKAATSHLKGVKIAVMGCIVNGPGEMADADFGYVGGAPDKINLYVKKEPIRFNIPQEEAVDCLIDLIKESGRWVDPQ